MQIPATQLRVGMVIEHRNELVRVTSVVHVTPGNWRGMVQTKLRKIDTGTQGEHRFRSEDKVERIVLEQHEMEYLYSDGDQYHFMNTENYEQVGLTADDLGDAVKYLKPNLRVEVEFHEHRPLGIELPKNVDLKVTDTEPGLRNATATNVLKPATVESGAIVQVPVFINIDDVIKVDTETGAYISRAK